MSQKKPLTAAQKLARSRYDSTCRTRVSVLLVNTTDADIIEFLKRCPNKQGLIKSLLREYIKSQDRPF
jgi:hypothetical protein